MLPETKPILFKTPQEFDVVEIYPIHDLHYGNAMFNEKKWNRLKAEILAQPNRYCIFVGDMMENATPNSKSDIFTQTHSPDWQKEWFADQLLSLADKTIAIIPGNHETNRTTKICGLYPLYDCAKYAKIEDRYRQGYAVVDIGVGKSGHGGGKQAHYVGYAVHKAKDMKNFSTADILEGFDFVLYGHDHDPKDHPRSHLCYDTKNKAVVQRDVETVNCGAFLDFGGYAPTSGYRPLSSKMYKLILHGERVKQIETLGFRP